LKSLLSGHSLKVNFAVVEAGSCYFEICSRNLTSRETAFVSSLPLVHSKEVTKTPRLLTKYENASFSGKTDFLDLAVFADEH